MNDEAVRDHVGRLLGWHEAHVGFDAAVADLPSEMQGRVPAGAPYSPWQLLEHLRIAQHDILDFCRNPQYEQLDWPRQYWPESAVPPATADWEESVAAFRRDRTALQALARDSNIDLLARIPHGSGQTYLRELLLAADHAAYHIGELVLIRRLLGAWHA
ncbi:MAG TPA: DinB family protein [Vicinamibacterales bacterium]|nr:DinB family protein [Vicinamibacterales bacterium]